MSARTSRNRKANTRRLRRNAGYRRPLLIVIVLLVIIAVAPTGEEAPSAPGNDTEISVSERLRSLPYLSWTATENSTEVGITIHDPAVSWPGYNLFKSGDEPAAFLIDNQGGIVHTWENRSGREVTWSNIEPANNSDLYVFVDYETLIRIDRDSNILWTSDALGFHHDLDLAANNDIYALTRKDEYIPGLSFTHRTANDYLTILSETEGVRKEMSVARLLLESGLPVKRTDIEADYPRNTGLNRLLAAIDDESALALIRPVLRKTNALLEKLFRPKDFLHTNTINIITGDVRIDGQQVFSAGHILICVRNQDLVAVVDPELEEIVWSWGPGELERPHDPVLLENGNLLIFDNGTRRKHSRIVELNPASKQIVWEYRGEPVDSFYSETRGSNQRLPNGNTLIADSRNGRALEVTREGDIVWEFFNPDIREVNGQSQRATIFRIRRYTNPDDYQLLKDIRPEQPEILPADETL